MPKFRVCVVESREHIVEVEADDETDAEDQAKATYEDHSVSESFREITLDWIMEISVDDPEDLS